MTEQQFQAIRKQMTTDFRLMVFHVSFVGILVIIMIWAISNINTKTIISAPCQKVEQAK